jgi:hypothetical protein
MAQDSPKLPAVTQDIFLSHFHQDAETATTLTDQLEHKAHVSVWLDRWVLVPGEQWIHALRRLEHVDLCCALA